MKKTYRTRNWGTDIEIFEVERETDSSVWIDIGAKNKAEMYRKISDSFRFFSTLDEAKKHLICRYIKDIEYNKKQIEIANEAIRTVQAIE